MADWQDTEKNGNINTLPSLEKIKEKMKAKRPRSEVTEDDLDEEEVNFLTKRKSAKKAMSSKSIFETIIKTEKEATPENNAPIPEDNDAIPFQD